MGNDKTALKETDICTKYCGIIFENPGESREVEEVIVGWNPQEQGVWRKQVGAGI